MLQTRCLREFLSFSGTPIQHGTVTRLRKSVQKQRRIDQMGCFIAWRPSVQGMSQDCPGPKCNVRSSKRYVRSIESDVRSSVLGKLHETIPRTGGEPWDLGRKRSRTHSPPL